MSIWGIVCKDLKTGTWDVLPDISTTIIIYKQKHSNAARRHIVVEHLFSDRSVFSFSINFTYSQKHEFNKVSVKKRCISHNSIASRGIDSPEGRTTRRHRLWFALLAVCAIDSNSSRFGRNIDIVVQIFKAESGTRDLRGFYRVKNKKTRKKNKNLVTSFRFRSSSYNTKSLYSRWLVYHLYTYTSQRKWRHLKIGPHASLQLICIQCGNKQNINRIFTMAKK